jgi:F-type H+-transporting ATPase subunit gamma
MTRLAEIQGHIASMSELEDIVSAMRSLAGMRMHEAQSALPGIRRYAETMAAAIGTALLLPDPPTPDTAPGARRTGRRALLLFTAEHGFVGGFNERILDAAEAAISAEDELFILGSRGAALALERGRKTHWTRTMPSRAAGAPDGVRGLTGALYTRIAAGAVTRVEAMFARYRQGAAPTIERRLLLPLDPTALPVTRAPQPPLHNLAAPMLVEKLIAEYVFALLTEATVESIASENAARFAAMDSARDNVERKLGQLRQAGRRARQDDITAELLDLVTGVEAAAQSMNSREGRSADSIR